MTPMVGMRAEDLERNPFIAVCIEVLLTNPTRIHKGRDALGICVSTGGTTVLHHLTIGWRDAGDQQDEAKKRSES